jgi:hypothetical protein
VKNFVDVQDVLAISDLLQTGTAVKEKEDYSFKENRGTIKHGGQTSLQGKENIV